MASFGQRQHDPQSETTSCITAQSAWTSWVRRSLNSSRRSPACSFDAARTTTIRSRLLHQICLRSSRTEMKRHFEANIAGHKSRTGQVSASCEKLEVVDRSVRNDRLKAADRPSTAFFTRRSRPTRISSGTIDYQTDRTKENRSIVKFKGAGGCSLDLKPAVENASTLQHSCEGFMSSRRRA